jgi:hypothetical protein
MNCDACRKWRLLRKTYMWCDVMWCDVMWVMFAKEYCLGCTWQNGQIQSLFPLDRANKQTKNMCKAQPESGLTYCVWESVSGQSTSTSVQLEQLIRVAFNSAKINWNLPSIPPRSIEIRLQFWPDQLKSTSDNQMGSVKTLVSCRQRHPTSR